MKSKGIFTKNSFSENSRIDDCLTVFTRGTGGSPALSRPDHITKTENIK